MTVPPITLHADVEEHFRNLAAMSGQSLEECVNDALARYLEELRDAEESDALYREFKAGGEQGIPWGQLKAEMDLKHGL